MWNNILPVFFILYALISVYCTREAIMHFNSRKFQTLEEKNKFRKLIYFVPLGQFIYLWRRKKRRVYHK